MPTPDYTPDELEAIRQYEAYDDDMRARTAAFHAGTDFADMPKTPSPPLPDTDAFRRALDKGYSVWRDRRPPQCFDHDFPDFD